MPSSRLNAISPCHTLPFKFETTGRTLDLDGNCVANILETLTLQQLWCMRQTSTEWYALFKHNSNIRVQCAKTRLDHVWQFLSKAGLPDIALGDRRVGIILDDLRCRNGMRLCHPVSEPQTLEGLSLFWSLKFLEVTYTHDLVSLPNDIGELKELTSLGLKNCDLTSLPERFGELESLTELNMGSCYKLQSLPERFGELRSLTSLNLGLCSELTSLPEGFGELAALTTLDLCDCGSLTTLPERFGELDLKELDLGACEALVMDTEINKIVEMKNLEDLKIWASNISVLPERFGELGSLTDLNLEWCTRLTALPKRFGELRSLTSLDLKYCPAGEAMTGTGLETQLQAQGCFIKSESELSDY